MLEVTFSTSAAGSLKVAQHAGEGAYRGGTIAFIYAPSDGKKPSRRELAAEKKRIEAARRRAWERARPLGGSTRDVFGFTLSLSAGDLSDDRPGPGRRPALELQSCMDPEEERNRYIGRLLREAEEGFPALLRRWRAGEGLRMWVSSQPEELCGLCWLLEKLEGEGGPLSMVRLPPFIQREDGAVEAGMGWGEIGPEEWGHYLSLEEPVSPALRMACASRWRELRAENAPLRAVVNGRLTGVPAEFYDGWIRRALAEEETEFHQARFIGNLMGRARLGIGDGLIAWRMEAMIATGELEPVTRAPEDGPGYRRILRKTGAAKKEIG